ncbi:hypothetical protein GOODEAATRI_030125, partial [Goodea atripinnis]
PETEPLSWAALHSDPVSAGKFYVFHHSHTTETNRHPVFLPSPAGNPVPAGERPPPEHSRRHRPVPLQRRGAQQDHHWGLLGRAV